MKRGSRFSRKAVTASRWSGSRRSASSRVRSRSIAASTSGPVGFFARKFLIVIMGYSTTYAAFCAPGGGVERAGAGVYRGLV